MFIVRTYVGPSGIHGNGVFAGEDLAQGQVIWEFASGLDLVVPFDRIAAAPLARYAIRKGEEITCDYRICCADWPGTF